MIRSPVNLATTFEAAFRCFDFPNGPGPCYHPLPPLFGVFFLFFLFFSYYDLTMTVKERTERNNLS
jgi:hypothetical protein